METTDFVEIFGGVHSIIKGCHERQRNGEVFDIRLNEKHNVHTREGLLESCLMLARLKPGKGTALVQPTCSSWGWVNRGTSLRGVEALLSNLG